MNYANNLFMIVCVKQRDDDDFSKSCGKFCGKWHITHYILVVCNIFNALVFLAP